MIARLLGKAEHDPLIDRVDHVLDQTKAIRIQVVPKNQRALAELRRLEGHARR